MIKILFVCHGNICRSPMAEYVMKDMVRRQGLEGEFFIDSAATSAEELGNGVHPGTRRRLEQAGIPCGEHRARRLCHTDGQSFDLIVGMDGANLRSMQRMLGPDRKSGLSLLLDYAGRPGQSIADPWYTGDFDETYRDVEAGCRGLLDRCLEQMQ